MRSDLKRKLYHVSALRPLGAGTFVKTWNELPKKYLCTFSVLNPMRSPFYCFSDKFCLLGQEWDILGQNTCDIIFLLLFSPATRMNVERFKASSRYLFQSRVFCICIKIRS